MQAFTTEYNLVPRALFPCCGGCTSKAREKRLGDEVEQSIENVSYLPCSLSGAASKVSLSNYYSFLSRFSFVVKFMSDI